MKAIVTGAAGFIGSALARRLLESGTEVVGIDCFTSYYDRATKEANLAALRAARSFSLVEADLRSAELASLLDGVDAVYHLAAQPGVRLSWSDGFSEYASHNILATQRLLDASVGAAVPRFVYASSSSVYGRSPSFPTGEDELPQPHSPYGVTKLAGEHLCQLYAANHGLPTVSLRYFTVFGPGQRPDMAIHRLLRAGLDGTPFPLFGDGAAIRDFTYVEDVVSANIAAASSDVAPGTVCNVAGGAEVSMAELIDLASEVLGVSIAVDRRPEQRGDVPRTGGLITRAHELLGWEPVIGLRQGLEAQAARLRGLEQRSA